MIQNQAGAGLAPWAIFVILPDVQSPEVFGSQVVLLETPKDARLAPDGFSNLRV